MSSEQIGLILTAALSVVLVVWQLRANRKLAKETGSFKQNIPTIRFLNFDLWDEVLYIIVYGADISSEYKVYIEFPLEVGNIGERTLEDLQLTISFPPNSSLPYDNQTNPYLTGNEDSIKRKFVKGSNESSINYYIQSIHPKVLNILAEYLTVPLSSQKELESFNLTFANQFNRSLLNKSSLTCQDFVTTLISKDNKPLKVYFKTFLFNCKNIEELMKMINDSIKIEIGGYPDNLFPVMLDLETPDTKSINNVRIGKISEKQAGMRTQRK